MDAKSGGEDIGRETKDCKRKERVSDGVLGEMAVIEGDAHR